MIWEKFNKATGHIKSGLELVNRIKKENHSLPFPSREQLQDAVKHRLAELDPLSIRVPFDYEMANQALERIFSKRRPCDQQNEQFRDACFWAVCVRYVRSGFRVSIITMDSDFLKKPNEPGLHPDLLDDLGEQRHEVEHFLNIDEYLEKHRPVEEATNPDLLESVNMMLRPELENILSANHFALEAIEQTKLRTIPVEGRTQLGLFEVTCTLQTTHSADTRSGAKATSVGSCEISLPSKVSDVQLDKTRLSWRDESGSTRQHHIAHLRSGLFSIGTTPAVSRLDLARSENPAGFLDH